MPKRWTGLRWEFSMRQFFFWTHFVIAFSVAIFVFLMSATGVLLTYEAQISRWARNAMVEIPANGEPLSIDDLAETAHASGIKPGGTLTVPNDRSHVVEASQGRRQRIYLDPYSGAQIGDTWADGLFSRVTAIHRSLAFTGRRSATGVVINDAANLLFAAILLTGAVLWWPRRWAWRLVKSKLFFRRGLPNTQARNFNWHHVFGVWAVLPLLAVVLSGVVLSYPWARDLVNSLASDRQQVVSGPASTGGPRPGNGSPKTLEELAALVTEGNNDWNRLSITLPEDGADVVEIAVDTGNGIQTSKIETFMVARDGSSVVDEEDDGGSGIVSFRFFRFLHTGEIFGAIGQTIAGLASLAAVFLAYTGISLGLGRLARMWRPTRHRAESTRIADG